MMQKAGGFLLFFYNKRLFIIIRAGKVNKVKIFSGPCYMIKCVLTFVSGVQESVLVDFISQNIRG